MRQYIWTVDSFINQLAEVAVRAGIGVPCYVGVGLVLIETKGRKSGSPRTVPVLANRIGDRLYVSTVRENSQWVRNLQADQTPTVVVDQQSQPVRVKLVKLGSWRVLRLDILNRGTDAKSADAQP
jgi:deazaflavin-dependent oxidoreductase (nitroreductase family)